MTILDRLLGACVVGSMVALLTTGASGCGGGAADAAGDSDGGDDSGEVAPDAGPVLGQVAKAPEAGTLNEKHGGGGNAAGGGVCSTNADCPHCYVCQGAHGELNAAICVKQPAGDCKADKPDASDLGSAKCRPTTCEEKGVTCGSIENGCGAKLACGSCAAPDTCGGGGKDGQCGHVCAAVTSCSGGQTCGTQPDGCGGTFSCGSCAAPDTCGGGGVDGQCGHACVPATCAALGANCGSVSDGCGGTLDCGLCAAPQVCGLTQPNLCGCTPTTCAALGANCGSVSDGCGGSLDCGGCTAPQVCGVTQPNLCGCTPTTCAALGSNCGSQSDGCGGTLDCGACSVPETCGGGGNPLQCGGCQSAEGGTGCFPGAVAWCNIGLFCQFSDGYDHSGTETCQPDGTWGPCTECLFLYEGYYSYSITDNCPSQSTVTCLDGNSSGDGWGGSCTGVVCGM